MIVSFWTLEVLAVFIAMGLRGTCASFSDFIVNQGPAFLLDQPAARIDSGMAESRNYERRAADFTSLTWCSKNSSSPSSVSC